MAFSALELQSGARAWRGASMGIDMSMGLLLSKKYRCYHEFSANTTLRFTITKPFLLTAQRLWTGAGAARLVVSTGGTPAGTFTNIPTQFCLNTKDALPTPAGVVAAGGTTSGGTEREVIRSDSGTSGGGVGSEGTSPSIRLLAPGTYYFTITVTGTTAGMYSFEWEELE